jgi:ABC-type glycerol-3-phosphate transport system substrate-binding protein
MKRTPLTAILTLAAVLASTLAVAGCGGKSSTTSSSPSTPASSTSSPTTTTKAPHNKHTTNPKY